MMWCTPRWVESRSALKLKKGGSKNLTKYEKTPLKVFLIIEPNNGRATKCQQKSPGLASKIITLFINRELLVVESSN